MEGVKNYIMESYDEMVHKVSWPSWKSLQNSAVIVLFTTFLVALIVYIMDLAFGQTMDLIYNTIFR